MTAEDPVEFKPRRVTSPGEGEHRLNFGPALRSFLRQDPNIILVGRIRDFETAEIAVKAALTGHLVLSTLHTTTREHDQPLMNMASSPSWWQLGPSHLRAAPGSTRVLELQGAEPADAEALMQAAYTEELANSVTPMKAPAATSATPPLQGPRRLYE